MSVLIVSNNDETLLGTRGYLTSAGIATQATRLLSEAWGRISEVNALLLFADDFRRGEVENGVKHLLEMFPRCLVVLVTYEAMHFESQLRPMGRSSNLVVLAKPAWGWDIVDALRGGARVDR